MSDDETVDELIEQLKTNKKQLNDMSKLELNKENLEHFLLQHSGLLISNSVKFVDDIKDYVAASPTPEDVDALAKLIQASSAALDSLAKMHISNEKNKTVKEVKQMDIDSRQQLQDTNINKKILINREELINELLKNADIIDADVKDITQLETEHN
jgi:hypothetical protein